MEPREVMLQWRLPLRVSDQRRMLVTLLGTLGVYKTPLLGLLGYYASRHSTPDPDEAWFVAFAAAEHAVAVADRIRAHFPGAFTRSTTDNILGDDLAWYRLRLHHITDIALSVTDDQQSAVYKTLKRAMSVPDPRDMPEGEARAEVYQQVLEGALMTAAPDAMTRAIASTGMGVDFWTDFVRRPHRNKDSLSPPGHWLWNLAL